MRERKRERERERERERGRERGRERERLRSFINADLLCQLIEISFVHRNSMMCHSSISLT